MKSSIINLCGNSLISVNGGLDTTKGRWQLNKLIVFFMCR